MRAVEIPKPRGGGTRILGVPSVGDRVAQTVVAGVIEAGAEPVFHPGSHGYRPGRSALDAVAVCRRRCWENDWVIDLDIRKFFDTMPWDLAVQAVQAVTGLPWVVLYVRRWLAAPLALPDGTLRQRDRGTPQGSASTPPTQKATSASRLRWVTGGWSGAGEGRVAGSAGGTAGVGSARVRARGGAVRVPGGRVFAVAQNVHVGDAWCGDAGV